MFFFFRALGGGRIVFFSMCLKDFKGGLLRVFYLGFLVFYRFFKVFQDFYRCLRVFYRFPSVFNFQWFCFRFLVFVCNSFFP